jgi:hypothetical protein
MNTNIGNYTDRQLLERAKNTNGFKGFPTGYWLLGIRSNEDSSDAFDDKFYLFAGENFIMVTSGTTNPGKYGLLNFKEYNSQGCAVMKAEEWFNDLWAPGMHKGKMKALVQISDVLYYRDNDMDLKAEEIGKVYKGIIGLNFHTATYTAPNLVKKFIAWIIGKWSVGCQVANVAEDYYKIIDRVWSQKRISYCLLKEF